MLVVWSSAWCCERCEQKGYESWMKHGWIRDASQRNHGFLCGCLLDRSRDVKVSFFFLFYFFSISDRLTPRMTCIQHRGFIKRFSFYLFIFLNFFLWGILGGNLVEDFLKVFVEKWNIRFDVYTFIVIIMNWIES